MHIPDCEKIPWKAVCKLTMRERNQGFWKRDFSTYPLEGGGDRAPCGSPPSSLNVSQRFLRAKDAVWLGYWGGVREELEGEVRRAPNLQRAKLDSRLPGHYKHPRTKQRGKTWLGESVYVCVCVLSTRNVGLFIEVFTQSSK